MEPGSEATHVLGELGASSGNTTTKVWRRVDKQRPRNEPEPIMASEKIPPMSHGATYTIRNNSITSNVNKDQEMTESNMPVTQPRSGQTEKSVRNLLDSFSSGSQFDHTRPPDYRAEDKTRSEEESVEELDTSQCGDILGVRGHQNVGHIESGSGLGTDVDMSMCIDRERQALLKFKQDLGDVIKGVTERETLFSSWESDQDCCKWRGIRCDNETNHVTALDFGGLTDSDTWFDGSIPDAFRNIPSLSHLDMSYNEIEGRIPSSTQLQSFDVSAYKGNSGLCGKPVTDTCPGDEVILNPQKTGDLDEEDTLITTGFYISLGLGFVFGFWEPVALYC
ncbi:hypothetical protein BUALT_Bualt03G0144300 [Buddleja alternifolia]|uniref:Leucine-rich repeat-containing N-terminal plant-type domain-containing protein n=1 Tax=Buddleja alternifolia TaxID=168488 RepID=A0AAV6XUV8_9LAMI|nr:hypothetical protein BUALT_Bualt03G0144300 [Buddleja alternifolia]